MIKDFICSQLLKDKFEEQRRKKINIPVPFFGGVGKREGYILIRCKKRMIYVFLYLRGYLLHYHIDVILKFGFLKGFFFSGRRNKQITVFQNDCFSNSQVGNSYENNPGEIPCDNSKHFRGRGKIHI